MKCRLFLAFFAISIAACDDDPPARVDASVDARPMDAVVRLDGADGPRADTATEVGADAGGADSSTGDGGAADLAPDGLADVGGTDGSGTDGAGDAADGALDLSSDLSLDLSSDLLADLPSDLPPSLGADADVACSPASRAMLCATYCEAIGRLCTGPATQYSNADACRAACTGPAWACGRAGELTGNSLFCRVAHLALAGVGGGAIECQNAGPSSPTCR
jgi:hypothetical protein